MCLLWVSLKAVCIGRLCSCSKLMNCIPTAVLTSDFWLLQRCLKHDVLLEEKKDRRATKCAPAQKQKVRIFSFLDIVAYPKCMFN